MGTKKKTCGGACCRRFILVQSPEELKQEYEAWLRNPGVGTLNYPGMDGTNKFQSIHAEIYLIYPMLIYLGYCEFEAYNPKKKTPGRFSHHYSCKHHDVKTGLCTIYEHRPYMCRRYPNGDSCPFPGCTLPGNAKRIREEKKRTSKKYLSKSKKALPCEEVQCETPTK